MLAADFAFIESGQAEQVPHSGVLLRKSIRHPLCLRLLSSAVVAPSKSPVQTRERSSMFAQTEHCTEIRMLPRCRRTSRRSAGMR
jgi:hypothetical protein